MKSKWFPAPGKVVSRKALTVQKAQALADYLAGAGENVFASFIGTRAQTDPPGDVVVFEVGVERPQKCAHDIRKCERMAAIFSSSDEHPPEVLALRKDFPEAPHINLREKEFPRSLCLYDQAYEDVRLTWTPANFLQRVRFWLERTATGNLHADDQPLEPLIIGSGAWLIVPSDFKMSDMLINPRLLDVSAIRREIPYTLEARWQGQQQGRAPDHIAVAFACAPQTHGVIRQLPKNLRELDALCRRAGLELVDKLTQTIRAWHLDKPAANVLKTKLVILLALPKMRKAVGMTEATETRAFLTTMSVENIGAALGAIALHGGVAGAIVGAKRPADAELEKLDIVQLEVANSLNGEAAAVLNGSDPLKLKVTAIGMGTIGSQIFSNLIRAGFGRWTLIDDDILLPHNCARHFLGYWALGRHKAESMAAFANALFDGEHVADALPVNVLKPGQAAGDVASALNRADLVIDFSASIAVARYLAHHETKTRAFSSYMTPRGDGLVVVAEDSERKVRLDWLEMLHYRQVLNQLALRQSLLPNDKRVRYGNACRDVSSQLAQDDAALWSAVASKALKQMYGKTESALRIYALHENGAVSRYDTEPVTVLRVTIYDWTIVLDKWLMEKLSRLRSERLPNETGGVLIGAFDTFHQVCSIVDVLPSPPDSKEWPTSYIRGCSGLREQVEEIQSLTVGQLSYVGEWHSHPDGCSTRPSADDLKAYQWLIGHMHLESLPGIMLIIGESSEFRLVSIEPS